MIKGKDISVSNMSNAAREQSPSRVYMEIGAHMAEDTLHYVLKLLEPLTTVTETDLKEGGK